MSVPLWWFLSNIDELMALNQLSITLLNVLWPVECLRLPPWDVLPWFHWKIRRNSRCNCLSSLDNINYSADLPLPLPYEVSNGTYHPPAIKVPDPDPQSGYEPVVSFPAMGYEWLVAIDPYGVLIYLWVVLNFRCEMQSTLHNVHALWYCTCTGSCTVDLITWGQLLYSGPYNPTPVQ